MKRATGLFARSLRDLNRFFNRLAVALTAFFVFSGALNAEAGVPFDGFYELTAHTAWQMGYAVKKPDDTWSDPKHLEFRVVRIQADVIQIEITPVGNSQPAGRLTFDRNPGNLRRIELIQYIRGQPMAKEIAIAGVSPVYPMFTNLPCFSPVFTDLPGPNEYLLKRDLNGSALIPENLEQRVETIERQTIIDSAKIPSKSKWESLVPPEPGFKVDVRKNGNTVFTQYWVPGRPWAVYTASENIRAWLEK